MSWQAVKAVRGGPTKGRMRAILVALANRSKQRGAPFFSNTSFRELTEDLGFSERHTIRLVNEAIQEGWIWPVSKGGGRGKNVWGIENRALTCATPPALTPCQSSSEEIPKVRTSRTEIPEKILFAEVDEEYSLPNVIPLVPESPMPKKGVKTPI